MVELLKRAAGQRIAVIGDAMLDVYVSGDVERISPEAPVPVVRVKKRDYALGGAANVAQNVRALGAECTLVAALGADSGGGRLRSMLGAAGILTHQVATVGRVTTQKTRIVARSQQLLRIDEEEDSPLTGAEIGQLIDNTRAAIDGADALVLEDYNKGVLTEALIDAGLKAAMARGIPIVVDPKFRHFFHFQGATIFKPNRRELAAAMGAEVDMEHHDALAHTVRRLGAKYLLLTLGEHGMVLVDEAGAITRAPTVAREVFDVVGAGDTVTAYLACMLASGASAAEAAYISNVAAGIEVGKLGAATVSSDELLEYVDTHALHHH
ncbi:MAG: bifunctional ADP-heptose synthase [Gemmatimonadota bacterium]